MPEEPRPAPQGPLDALQVPRFAGPATFARLPTLEAIGRCDVAILGIPFDSGVTYRPGARFGPSAIRQGSRLLRGYHPGLDVEPFFLQQVVDAGDVACTPFAIEEALAQIQAGVTQVLQRSGAVIALGGDHTVALAMLRAVHQRQGPVAVVHLDAHLDTWSTYFGAAYTHGTPFRRAAEEGLLVSNRSVHVGIRGPLFSRDDLPQDSDLGFRQIETSTVAELGAGGVAEQIRERVGDAPVYISVDIDVLDPAHAPGTGTPEPAGLDSRELLGVLRKLAGLPIVSADVVEVAPAYDHAEITAVAAAHVVYELLGLLALGPAARS
jgi:agmatinase